MVEIETSVTALTSKEELRKIYKSILLLKNLSNKLPKLAVLAICKSPVTPHIDESDISCMLSK